MKVYRPVFTPLVITFDIAGNILVALLMFALLGFCVWIGLSRENRPPWQSACFIPLATYVLYVTCKWIFVQWRMWIRKERWTTYFQTWNTLAIKVPGEPFALCNRWDCVAYMPGHDCLVLHDGKRLKLPGVPAGEVHNLSRVEEIVQTWWPEVDFDEVRCLRKRKLPFGVVIGVWTVGGVLGQLMYSLTEWFDAGETRYVISLACLGWLFLAIAFVSKTILRGYFEFQYPLSQGIANLEEGHQNLEQGNRLVTRLKRPGTSRCLGRVHGSCVSSLRYR